MLVVGTAAAPELGAPGVVPRRPGRGARQVGVPRDPGGVQRQRHPAGVAHGRVAAGQPHRRQVPGPRERWPSGPSSRISPPRRRAVAAVAGAVERDAQHPGAQPPVLGQQRDDVRVVVLHGAQLAPVASL